MVFEDVQFATRHRNILNRFLRACQADDRIIAAFLVGSHAKGKADENLDLDLYVATTDEAFDDFVATREFFVRRLGEPVFVEDFGNSSLRLLKKVMLERLH